MVALDAGRLFCYSVFTLLWKAIAFTAARLLRWPGIFLGHLVIAAIVVVLDIRWIQAEMHAPGWNGQPDQDIMFALGAFLRIVLINTVLLPVSLFAILLTKRPVPAP